MTTNQDIHPASQAGHGNGATNGVPSARACRAAGRHDLYGPIHKAIRFRHAALLQRLGSTDFRDDIRGLAEELRKHLQLCLVHLKDEETHLHHPMARRLPGALAQVERQHVGHRAHLNALEAEIRLLEANPEREASAGHGLYLAFSRFVADDLLHMAHEEEQVWPLMCSAFDDAEMARLEADIVAGLPPELATRIVAIMLVAINPPERDSLLGMGDSMPGEGS